MSNLLYSHREEDLIRAARLIANEFIESMKTTSLGLDVEGKTEDLMTQFECAKFLNVTVGTLIIWRKNGKIPYYKSGRSIFYSKSKVLNAIQGQ